MTDGVLMGAEALVRWQHPERGLIPPGQFIPVAEASDLIVALGDWMLVEVCRQLASLAGSFHFLLAFRPFSSGGEGWSGGVNGYVWSIYKP